LRALGVRIAIDDFRLSSDIAAASRRVALTTLKIDPAIVANAASDGIDRGVCAASVAFARAAGLRLVAEGVETEAQMSFVLGLGVDEVQGHLTGRPIPPDQFVTQLGKVVPLGRASRRA
jgi:EAL domain-containing protein (putative c-di-GMP-specific phosphodiesterase class I)